MLNRKRLPSLTEEQIIAWAKSHQARTGKWPAEKTGKVLEAPGETWLGIAQSLRAGLRGLRGGSSLACLLAKQCGVRNRSKLPRYFVKQILAWADTHHERTGEWPHLRSGPIAEAPGETWWAVETALVEGQRGLPGGDSLYRLLRRCRRIAKRGPFSRDVSE
jgi:hypothetical protein